MLPPEPVTQIDVVGIGESGWPGLAPTAAAALAEADVVIGSPRQLAFVEAHVGKTETWPSPMTEGLETFRERHPGRVAVLASGDPMLFGVGSTLVRLFGAGAIRVHPHPSSVSLACARLGWPVETTTLVSAVGRPLEALAAELQVGRRILVLVADVHGASRIADLLRDSGFGASRRTLLERLGGPSERISTSTAEHDPLAIVAIDVIAEPGVTPLPKTPGLPDDAFDSDGALTKSDVRAITLARLMPRPGQLLWDVGAGSGSIGIEWMRADRTCRAIAIEPRADRCARIRRNAAALGVPGLEIVEGKAPEALAGLEEPDAIFIGGGQSATGLVESCLDALAVGGLLVANGVTIEAESDLAGWHARNGGRLTRISVSHADALGGFTAFRPALPVTQWVWTKP